MRFNTFWAGVCAVLALAWVTIFFAGPAIDDICVRGKVSMSANVLGKKGEIVKVRVDDRIVARECSEFSRTFFLRDKPNAKKLRKAVGAQ
jgi:hypothetical protein